MTFLFQQFKQLHVLVDTGNSIGKAHCLPLITLMTRPAFQHSSSWLHMRRL